MTDFKDKHTAYFSEDFVSLDLSQREMSALVFEDCTFDACNLSETIFNECDLRDCRFVNCNLSVVKVKASTFSGIIFDTCKIIGIDWTRASWPSIALQTPLKFYKCVMNDSSFFGLKMKDLVIKECQAQSVDFREGHFQGANFVKTDLSDSLFMQTDLEHSDFTDATHYAIDIRFNKVTQAKFSRFEALNLLALLEIDLVD